MTITNNDIIIDVARDLRGVISLGLGAQQMTEDELAKRLGVNQTAVSHWLTGRCKPRKSRFADICRAFEIENVNQALNKYY